MCACDSSVVISQEMHPNGNVKKRFKHVSYNDLKCIQYEHFNKEGALVKRGIVKDDAVFLAERYVNEQLVYQKRLSNDSLHIELFDSLGQITSKTILHFKSLQGSRKVYYPGERVMYIDEVKENVQHGKSHYFLKNGMLKSMYNYRNDSLVDAAYIYNNHAVLEQKIIYLTPCLSISQNCETDTLQVLP